jgi:antitoxin component YwqK of YwqJK toxin-antitoxin module
MWIWRYGDGSKAFEGEYSVGVPTGRHKYWYPNGQTKMKGEYEGGELSGQWDYYQEDGTLILQLEYEAGQVIKINGSKIKLPQVQE